MFDFDINLRYLTFEAWTKINPRLFVRENYKCKSPETQTKPQFNVWVCAN